MNEFFAQVGALMVSLFTMVSAWPWLVRLGCLVVLAFIASITRQISRASTLELVRVCCAIITGIAGLLAGLVLLVFIVQGVITVRDVLPLHLDGLI